MQSEPYCPRIILSYIRAACGEECAADHDSSMRTVLNLHVDPRLLLASPTSARYIAIVLGCVLCYTYDLNPPLSGRLTKT